MSSFHLHHVARTSLHLVLRQDKICLSDLLLSPDLVVSLSGTPSSPSILLTSPVRIFVSVWTPHNLNFTESLNRNLANNLLKGFLYEFQGCQLEVLILSNNNFFGSFPASLSKCRKLRDLNVAFNNFEGSARFYGMSPLSFNQAGHKLSVLGQISHLVWKPLILHQPQRTSKPSCLWFTNSLFLVVMPELSSIDMSFNHLMAVEVSNNPKLKTVGMSRVPPLWPIPFLNTFL